MAFRRHDAINLEHFLFGSASSSSSPSPYAITVGERVTSSLTSSSRLLWMRIVDIGVLRKVLWNRARTILLMDA